MSESNPLVDRVDALLKRHQQASAASAPVSGGAGRAPGAADTGETSAWLIRPTAPLPGEPAAETEDRDIPVLTEIVDPEAEPAGPVLDKDALAVKIEAEVLEKLLAELDDALDQRLGRKIGELLEQALDGLRAELSISVRRMLREAVAASIAKALDERARDL